MRIEDMTDEERKAYYREHNLKFRTDHPNYYREYYERNCERIKETARNRYRLKCIMRLKKDCVI